MPANSGGKRGRSGPPGNLNATRHPWRSFWRRRALRAQDRWILGVLEDYRDEILAWKGGADEMGPVARHVLEIAEVARGCALLILADSAQYGRVRVVEQDGSRSWDLAPGLKELGKFMKIELQALATLGAERAEPKAIDLRTYLESRETITVGRNGDDHVTAPATETTPEREPTAPPSDDGDEA